MPLGFPRSKFDMKEQLKILQRLGIKHFPTKPAKTDVKIARALVSGVQPLLIPKKSFLIQP